MVRTPGLDIGTRIGARLASIIDLGARSDQAPRLVKAIRLCNVSAMVGLCIMAAWALVESHWGQAANLMLEIALVLGFAGCLLLNALGWHRAGRLGMLLVAEFAVFIGAVLFQPGTGGTLPFIAMIGLPFLLFRPCEVWSLVLGIGATVALFVLCETSMARGWLQLQPRPAPPWYFGANAATAFALSLLIPTIFYRASLRAETELELQGTEKLKRLIDTNIIGVARGKFGGPVLEANEAFLNLLGYTREDLIAGRIDLAALTPHEHREASRRAYRALLERGACAPYEKEYLRKDGTPEAVLVGMSLLDRAHQDTVGFVLDLSSRNELERQRRIVRDKEEAVRMRDLFTSIASHELKTPLASLVLLLQRAAQVLEQDATSRDAALQLVSRSQSSAKKLSGMVDELLDLARASQGKLDLSPQSMDLVQAVRDVVSTFEASGTVAPNQVRINAPVPVTGTWDPARMDQVITNLVSNAIKYGAGRPIEIAVAASSADAAMCKKGDPEHVHLEVVDHGMGISNDMLDKIFDPFQRAVSGKDAQGLGLGLFVVKSIVEAHGGKIHVASRRDEGSHFVVDLPRHAA